MNENGVDWNRSGKVDSEDSNKSFVIFHRLSKDLVIAIFSDEQVFSIL